jgi:hypothetical protein
MGLRWWRDVLIRNQTKRYLDDRQARKYWFVCFVRPGDADFNGLKIRWEQSREGSSPSLGTNHFNSLQPMSVWPGPAQRS